MQRSQFQLFHCIRSLQRYHSKTFLLAVPLYRFGIFNKNSNEHQNLKQISRNIPDLDLQKSLIANSKYDMNFVHQEFQTSKLRQFQKHFYENPNDVELAYKYTRQLNRMKMFKEINELNDSYFSKPALSSNLRKILVYLQSLKSRSLSQVDQANPIRRQQQIQEDISSQNLETIQVLYIIHLSPLFRLTYRQILTYTFLTMLFYQWFVEDFSLYESVWRKLFRSAEQSPSGKSEKQQKNRIDRIMNLFVGKSQEVQEETNINTRFSDVLGINEFKEELEEIVDYLKQPEKYTKSGAKLPKGLLLVGPPGTGKTLLARALAGEANCSFFYKSGSEFDEMFVGIGASRIRELFQKAREKAPSIIFLDEIDSIGGNRNVQDVAHSRDTINQILTEMDGFKQSEGVIVVGATNFDQGLDPALRRPGRFDKIINVPLPDMQGREEIIKYYLKKIKCTEDIDVSLVAKQTVGFTGADIQNMVNIAILNGIKEKREYANKLDVEFALDRIQMGIGRKNLLITEQDKLTTAYHEGGHALTSLLTSGSVPLHKITILPRGNALGYTSLVPDKEDLNWSRKGLLAQIDVALGGRAAEELFFGKDEVSSGCSNDLTRASELAYLYIKKLGMEENVSLISVSEKIKTSEKYDYMVDMEVKKLLDESYARVKRLLMKNEEKLKNLAMALVRHETMSGDEVRRLLQIK